MLLQKIIHIQIGLCHRRHAIFIANLRRGGLAGAEGPHGDVTGLHNQLMNLFESLCVQILFAFHGLPAKFKSTFRQSLQF